MTTSGQGLMFQRSFTTPKKRFGKKNRAQRGNYTLGGEVSGKRDFVERKSAFSGSQEQEFKGKHSLPR